jgi:hypothetical protein
VATRWIDALAEKLRQYPAFGGCALRPATRDDETYLFELHRAALSEYVDATWGWDDDWQRAHFAAHYAPARNALIVRAALGGSAIGRISPDTGARFSCATSTDPRRTQWRYRLRGRQRGALTRARLTSAVELLNSTAIRTPPLLAAGISVIATTNAAAHARGLTLQLRNTRCSMPTPRQHAHRMLHLGVPLIAQPALTSLPGRVTSKRTTGSAVP